MRVAMLLHKSVEHDSRVRREACALAAAGHEVTVLHLPREPGELDGPLDGFAVRSATPPAWVRRRLPFALYRLVFFAAYVGALARLRPDVVHAHDAAMLAPGWCGARLTRAALIYDSHEYAAGVPYRERAWALFVTTLERAVVPRCDAVVTVSEGIADRLRDRYRLRERPAVVRNVPDLAPPGGASPSGAGPGGERPSVAGAAGGTGVEGPVPGLRERLGIGAEEPLVLHQGATAPGRGCEQLVRAVARLPEARLAFLGEPWPGYDGVLERLAAEVGVGERVHFLPSVPIDRLLALTAEATVGASLLQDSCENHRLALPNKVFEYVAAGVPVVAGDLPELRALVERHGCGVLADPSDPDAVAHALGAAIADRDRLAAAARAAAGELTWSRERERLTGLYRRLGERRGKRALVLVRNGVTHDARVQREARLLAELGHDVLVIGVVAGEARAGDERVDGIAVRRLAPRHLGRRLTTLDFYRRAIAQVWRERPALVHCNDYNTMWVGVAAKLLFRARVVYDSHELWPDRNLRQEWRPWLVACEWLFVRVADRAVTTSPGYARETARRYRVPSPTVVRNLPDDGDAESRAAASGPAGSTLPDGPAAGSHPASPAGRDGRRLAVYFGAITRGRGLERAVAALERHPDLELRLVGPQAWGFRAELEALARRLGVDERVELPGPVPPGERDAVLGDADVGLALIEPVCLSYRLTLPNKLFEYIASGLPVVATDLPEIAAALEAAGAGVTVDCDDDVSLDAGLRAALDPVGNARLRAAASAAAGRLTWAAERERLAAVYRELVALPPAGGDPSDR